jgi:hypothetical protein
MPAQLLTKKTNATRTANLAFFIATSLSRYKIVLIYYKKELACQGKNMPKGDNEIPEIAGLNVIC